MNATLATRTLTWGIGLLVALGLLVIAAGVPLFSPVFLLAAIGLGIGQRSRLAEALRVVEPPRRNSRFKAAGFSGLCFLAAVGAYMVVTWDGTASSAGLLIPTVVGTASLVGMTGWLFAALLTPRAPQHA